MVYCLETEDKMVYQSERDSQRGGEGITKKKNIARYPETEEKIHFIIV